MQFSWVNLLFVNYIHLIMAYCSYIKKLVSEAILYIYIYIYIWNYSELLISECNNSVLQTHSRYSNLIDIQVIFEMIGKFATLRKQLESQFQLKCGCVLRFEKDH